MADRLDEGDARVTSRFTAALRVFAAALFVVYLWWNAYWLARGRMAPALFLGLTGIPAPTTGSSRSLLALADGDWRESLRQNALAVPLTAVFFYAILRVVWCVARRRRVALPAWIAWSWLGLLAVAGIAKVAVYAIGA